MANSKRVLDKKSPRMGYQIQGVRELTVHTIELVDSLSRTGFPQHITCFVSPQRVPGMIGRRDRQPSISRASDAHPFS